MLPRCLHISGRRKSLATGLCQQSLDAALAAAPRVCDTVIAYTHARKPEKVAERPPKPIKSLKRAWQTAQKAAGITKPYRFHDLRATFCTAVLAANNNPMDLKSAARHAFLNTTMRYLKLADAQVRSAFNATKGLLEKSQTESHRQDTQEDGVAPDGASQPIEKS